MVSAKIVVLVPFVVTAYASSNWPAGKRGLASNDDVDLRGFENTIAGHSKVRWQYNWDSNINNNKISFAEYVPMLWGDQSYHTNQWNSNVRKWTGKGSKHLLGFNEPERGDQANMSPQHAADAWRRWMQPYAGNAKLGAPAVSNDGYSWLQQFMNACHDCHIDFVPIHWYNDHSIEFDLENWVNKICQLTKKPVWVTEFKGFGSEKQQQEFLAKAMAFLEKSSCVERYAYFGSADNDKDLLSSNPATHLSDLGIDYGYH